MLIRMPARPPQLDDGDTDPKKKVPLDAKAAGVVQESKEVPAAQDAKQSIRNPELEGWVYKQSRYMRSWRKRWMVLQFPFLYTFREQRQYQDPTEKIDMRDGVAVKAPRESEIELLHPDRTYYFRVDSPSVRDRWVRTLVRVLARGVDDGAMPGFRVIRRPAHMGVSQAQSYRDVEEEMIAQAMRQSLIDAGLPVESAGGVGTAAGPSGLSVDTKLRREQDKEYERALEEDMKRERESMEGAASGPGRDSEREGPDNTQEQGLDSKALRKRKKKKKKKKKRAAVGAADVQPADDGKQAVARESGTAAAAAAAAICAVPSVPDEPPEGASDACVCRIRLADGKSLVRRFRLTDTVQDVINAVKQRVGNDATDFQLVSNYPRRVWADTSITLAATNLGNKCLFFVNPVVAV